MKLKVRKIDAIIIVALIIIATGVFFKVGYIPDPINPKPPRIEFRQDDVNNRLIVTYVSTQVLWSDINITGDCDKSLLTKYVHQGDEIIDCQGTITIRYKDKPLGEGTWHFKQIENLPGSITNGLRNVAPLDEGPHYQKLLVNREWWHYTAVLSMNCDLPGWTISISFNHMARNDLFKNPDIFIVTLQDPKGKTYGGIIDRSRPLGLLRDPVLTAEGSDSGFSVYFEDSYVKGKAPDWHVYIKEDEFESKDDLIIDLTYFASSSPIWLFNSRILDKSDGKTGSYMFTGCEVEGTIEINGLTYGVEGIGHHEHTWTSIAVLKSLINGWDICHIKLNNGWNVYYNKYYVLPQLKAATTLKFNPFSKVIITTDQGETLTILDNVDIEIIESDKLFLLLNIPTKTKVTAKSSFSQFFVEPYEINLEMNIDSNTEYVHEWRLPSYVGMKISRCDVSGSVSWKDDGDNFNIDLEGIGTIWHMRH